MAVRTEACAERGRGRRIGTAAAADPGGRDAAGGGPVVLVDKDGTLIEDLPYNVDPARIRLAPGARRAVRRLGAAGYRLAIVTNQSGVARGYSTLEDLDRVRDHLARVVQDLGSELAAFYACPHHPRGTNEYAVVCDCRKPLPALARQAVEDLGLEAARTWFVGDTWMDVAAGRGAGCRTILVGPESRYAHTLPPGRRPDVAVRTLDEAATAILGEDAG